MEPKKRRLIEVESDTSDSGEEEWTTAEESSSEEDAPPQRRFERIVASPPPESSSSGAFHAWKSKQTQRRFYKRVESMPSQSTVFIDETPTIGKEKKKRFMMTAEEADIFYNIVLNVQNENNLNAGFANKPGDPVWQHVHELLQESYGGQWLP